MIPRAVVRGRQVALVILALSALVAVCVLVLLFASWLR